MKLPHPNSPRAPKLTPTQRLVLTLWTLIVAVVCLIFFRRFGPRVFMLMMVVGPLIGGVLFGLRMLDKLDGWAKLLGLVPAEPPPPGPSGTEQYAAFVEFLRSHEERGEFALGELQRYCRERVLTFAKLHPLGLQKGWYREMGSTFVLTSTGMEMLAASRKS